MSATSLQHFIEAQNEVYEDVTSELRAGRKRTHWMWFIFPQHRALGRSAMAQRFGIDGLAHAQAYLGHPLLAERLKACCGLLLRAEANEGRSIRSILGEPDDMKLRSSMTLFNAADPAEPLFSAVLDRYYQGERDPLTLALLANEARCGRIT